jgi:hypothetical protein
MPRKRVKFNENTPVIQSSFGSDDEIFCCTGGYFSHHSYNLLDFFVSCWFEIFNKKWKQKYGSGCPKVFSVRSINRLSEFTPILKLNLNGANHLQDYLIYLFQQMGDYTIINEISDLVMRKHQSLQRMSSMQLNEVIDKTSKAKLKIIYPIRIIKEIKKHKFLGWKYISNLEDKYRWGSLFEYGLINERKGKDGRVIERIYKFGFNSLLGIAMIHNTICSGTWSVNPKLYAVSGDAQLLYRYLVITGSRFKNHRIDYIGHRLGWREEQKSRLERGINRLFEELKNAGLIRSYNCKKNGHGKIYYSFEVLKSTGKRKARKSAREDLA